jgi:hypothetical protein
MYIRSYIHVMDLCPSLSSRPLTLQPTVEPAALPPSLRKAAELIPEDDPANPDILSNLGGALRVRFEHLGNFTDMKDAISSL